MFRRLEEGPGAHVRLSFEGTTLEARAGESLAAALLAAGIAAFRETPRHGKPRGPLCMMGACFDCLVEVDGAPGLQACLVTVAEGMAVRRQQGPSTLAIEPLEEPEG